MWSINNKRCCLLKSCSKICDDKKREGEGEGEGEAAGLRILTKIGHGNSNVVIKPIIFLASNSNSSSSSSKSESDYCSYLKCCHLCHKDLPLDKEIYMYRGDLGFCSVECRERQIYLDEIELSTPRNRMFSSFRHDRCQLPKRRRHPFSSVDKTTSASVVFS